MKTLTLGLSSLVLLAACAATPMGPTAQVMPNPSKPFAVFQQDQDSCKQFAQSQVAGQADEANKQAVGAAVLGTVLGGAVGAAAGNSRGAGIGGASGALLGTAVGAQASANGQMSIQTQYDNAYVQCMYAKGHQVPALPMAASAKMPAGAPDAQAPASGAPMTLVQAQTKLNAMGFPVGRPDGVMGRRTREQLILFQKSRGISETGELDADTIDALNN